MKNLLARLIFLFCLIGGVTMMDDIKVEPASTDGDQQHEQEAASILSHFFSNQGFNVDVSDEKLVKRYSMDVIERMDHLLDVLAGKVKDNVSPFVYDINAAINTMIYMNELTRYYGDKERTSDDQYEALLSAIDLIVPNTNSDPIYQVAKKELAEFYKRQKDVGKELLDRLSTSLMDERLTTGDAAMLLRHFYYHWIPLGDLAQFAEKNTE